MANKNFKIFDGLTINTSPTSTEKISSNYAIAFQIVWSGLSGTANLGIGVSMDGTNFDAFPFIDSAGSRVTSIPISGANGSATIEIESVVSDWIKFTVDGSSATGGLITGYYSQIDNQDTY
tara:strand:- start:84 stop:446 length:363 start_codon:yes stop_codon:yes gene_type:complete